MKRSEFDVIPVIGSHLVKDFFEGVELAVLGVDVVLIHLHPRKDRISGRPRFMIIRELTQS